MFASSVHPAPSLCPDSSILDWSRRRSSQLSQHRQVMQTQRQVMQGHSREVDISHFIMELSNILNLILVANINNFSLHRYEQSCSQDPDTKSCAAPLPQCRDAMVEILGTDLRTNCACAGTAGDFRELFECIEYQRLFWSNPCVGKINCTKPWP